LRRWSAKQGISPAVTLRDLRHTYSTLGLQGSNDAAAVQAAMGHSDLRTTQLYQSSTVARVAKVGVAVAASVFGKPKAGRAKRSKKGGTQRPAHKDDDAAKPLESQHARLAQLDRATVSEADDIATYLANFSFTGSQEAQQNPEASKPFPAHKAGTPEPEYIRYNVHCTKCGRMVDVEDGPGLFECVVCGSKDVVLEL
jgi:hypothetical protein